MRGLSLALVSAVLLASTPAQAREDEEFRYSFDQVWSAAVRMVRVDMGFPIEERDEELGFLLFTYREGKKELPGSIELIRPKQAKSNAGVMAVVQIPSMPAYVERVMLNHLGRKLKADYGLPVTRPSKPAQKPEKPQPSDKEKDNKEAAQKDAKDTPAKPDKPS